MDLDLLHSFCTVVRTGSMTRAAQTLHLTQPAVSQKVRLLESKYGVELLRRSPQGVEVTPAGEILARYARRMLDLQRSLERELEALRSLDSQHLQVGAATTAGGYALPCTVYLFQQRYPQVRVELVIANSTEILQRFLDGALPMAVVEGPVCTDFDRGGNEIQVVPLTEEELILVTPATGPLSQRDRYDLEQLRQVPLIVREPGSGTRRAVEEALMAAGLSLRDLRVAMELSGIDAVKTSVEQGHGVALLSRWTVRKELRTRSLRAAALEGLSVRVPWSLLYRRDRSRTEMERRFVAFLRSPKERGFC